MIELCNILKININDLFSGEVVDMKDNEKKLEENLFEMAKLKEEKDKQLLRLEMVIGYSASITFLVLIFVASFVEMTSWLRLLLIIVGSVIFAFCVGNAVKIEQVAGYYECPNCNHKNVPEYSSVFWAQHMGRTRKMKCPKCDKKTWQRIRTITTDDIRHFMSYYQEETKCSNSTLDNVRRMLSRFFEFLEVEDYIVKSPVRRTNYALVNQNNVKISHRKYIC